MAEISADSYDEIPYPSGPFRQTHPCQLATLPVLFGVEPVPPTECRVLELGCASGGNLIPMAQDLPGSEFLGIDLSRRQIADGLALLDQLSLDNIQLRAASILDVDETYGQFDYIICHGVYSWVPPEVQQKILEIGRRHLTPRGVLYVSYNTYPGWHLRAVVRDMMLYHVAPITESPRRIGQARLLLDFLVKSATAHSEAYRQVLSDEAAILRSHSDSYLLHEHLEAFNSPCYFHEFAQRTGTAGLQYLGDTDFSTMVVDNLGPEVSELLGDASILRQEQYMDFLRARTFRCTVLCHKELELLRHIEPTRLSKLHVGLRGPLRLEGDFDDKPSAGEIEGRAFHVQAPITKSALRHLNLIRPAMLECDDLFHAAQQQLEEQSAAVSGDDRDSLHRQLLIDLMTLLASGTVEASYAARHIMVEPSEYPRATELARVQAQCGDVVTTRRHEQVRLELLSRGVLTQLDGRHNRAMLCSWLRTRVASGELTIRLEGEPVRDATASQLERLIGASLKSLAANAILID